jgi:hypothetical protein
LASGLKVTDCLPPPSLRLTVRVSPANVSTVPAIRVGVPFAAPCAEAGEPLRLEQISPMIIRQHQAALPRTLKNR